MQAIGIAQTWKVQFTLQHIKVIINLKIFRKSIDKCFHKVYSNIIKQRKEVIHMKQLFYGRKEKWNIQNLMK